MPGGLLPTIERFLSWKRGRGVAPATVIQYRRTLRQLVEEYPDAEPSDFEPPAGTGLLQSFTASRWGDRAASTLSTHLSVLGEFFQWCVREGLLVGDPMVAVERPARTRAEARIVPPEVIMAIINSAEDNRDRLGLEVLLHVGVGRAELRTIRLRDYNSHTQELTLVRPTGKRRTVKVEHAAVRLAFDKYIEERRATLGTRQSGRPLQRVLGEYILFSRRSGPAAPVSDQGVHNWWRRMLSNAGAPDYSMPDARRTAEQQTGQRYVSEDVASLRALTGQIRDPLVRGYVEESILCLEVGALRAAIVFLWTAAIRELREAAWSKGGRVVNPAIKKQDARARTIKKADDFAYVTDRAFLDASPSMGLLDKGQKDTLVEALNLRNRCGHPTQYKPGVDKARGFIADVVGIVWQ